MRWLLLIALTFPLMACGKVTETSARAIACSRLGPLPNGPTLKGAALCSALEISAHHDGMFLAELRDKPQNRLWAVVVSGSGESEISSMDDNEEQAMAE